MSNRLIKEKAPKRNRKIDPAKDQEGSRSRWITWPLAVLNMLIGAISLSGILALRPDVTIDPYATTDASEPFAERFYVQNLSPYSIHDVQPNCTPDITTVVGGGMSGINIENTREKVSLLQSQAKTTLICPTAGFGPWLSSVKVTPWVEYKTFFGWRHCKGLAFEGTKTTEGTYIWEYRGSDPTPCQMIERSRKEHPENHF